MENFCWYYGLVGALMVLDRAENHLSLDKLCKIIDNKVLGILISKCRERTDAFGS